MNSHRSAAAGDRAPVEPRWVENQLKRRRRALDWESPRSPWRAFRAWDLGGTTDAAFGRKVISHPEIGLMDEAQGPGLPSGVGEDRYLLYRIVRAGYTVVCEPRALVYHRHRNRDDELARQLTAYYAGHGDHNPTTLLRDRDLRAVTHLSRFAANVAGTRRRSMIGRAAISTASARAQPRGAAAGPVNYVRSQRRVRQQGRSGSAPESTATVRESPRP